MLATVVPELSRFLLDRTVEITGHWKSDTGGSCDEEHGIERLSRNPALGHFSVSDHVRIKKLCL